MQFRERVIESDKYLLRHRKPISVCERVSVIHHGHAETRRIGRTSHGHRNMAAPKQVHNRLR